MLLSKDKPETDPLILWLQGGPGASSMYGLMIQWSSKIIACGGERLYDNPFPLNERATVIFLDNPADFGFSIRKEVKEVDNSRDSTLDILDFLAKLRKTAFENHKFEDQPLHIMGTSLAAHYISALGDIITKDPMY